MTYAEKLKDPRWKAKRSEVLERDGHTCKDCGACEELHVHHCAYQGRDPWDTDSSFLITICASCHTNRHSLEAETKEVFARLAASLPVWEYWELSRIARDRLCDIRFRGGRTISQFVEEGENA